MNDQNVRQALIDSRLNAFAFDLAAESLLRSPVAGFSADKAIEFFLPIRRDEFRGWIGVSFTVQAVREPMSGAQEAKP